MSLVEDLAGIGKSLGAGENLNHLSLIMTSPCKHPIVKIVARQDDAEFVECQACGEVFDSVEFKDMELEEKEDLGEAPE